MSCKYIYKGVKYSKEELIEAMASDGLPEAPTASIYKSIATNGTRKKKQSKIVKDTVKVLYQRIAEAENIIKAIQQSNLPDSEKVQKKAYYRNLVRKARQEVTNIREEAASSQLDAIINLANEDAALIDALFDAPSISLGELQFGNNVVETWLSLQDALGVRDNLYTNKNLDPDLRDKLLKLEARFSVLDGKSRSIAVSLLKEAAKKTGDTLTDDDFSKIVDTTYFTYFSRELGTAGVPLTNRIAYLIKRTNLEINREHNATWEEIDKKTKGIKDFSIFLKKQKNSGGKEVLAIVSKYSQNFWDTFKAVRRKLRSEVEAANGDKQKEKRAWTEFHQWNEKHTIAFNGLLFINRNQYTDDQRNQETNKLRQLGFNTSEINDIISESIKRFEMYKKRLVDYTEEVRQAAVMSPQLLKQGQTVDEFVNEKVAEFESINNPLLYMEQKFFGNNRVTAYGGARYTYLIPAKSVEGKDSGYYDANFIKISNDPKLYAFYQWFTKFLNDCLSWLPQEEIEDLQSNFLPVIADRMAKEYGLSSLQESVAGLGDWFLKSFTVSDFENKVDTNPFTGKEIRQFKSRFINENVPLEEQSTDLGLIAKMFSDMALVYKHKNTIKAEIDTLNDLLQSNRISYERDTELGILNPKSEAPTTLQSLADWTIRRGFYGIPTEDKLTSDKVFYDWKELIPILGYQSDKAKQAQAIQDKIKEINEKLEDENLSESEKNDLYAKRDAYVQGYYELGGRKFSLTKALDSSVETTRLTALGFSPLSALRNLFVGKINNRIHSAGGRDFGKEDMSWAQTVLRMLTTRYWSGDRYESDDTVKVFGILTDSEIVEGDDGMYLKKLISSKTTLNQLRSMLPKAYTWLSGGDYHFKAEMLLAAMHAQKVKTSKGTFTFYEVLNKDRTLNTEKFGEWDQAGNDNKTFDEFFIDKMLKYRMLANKLHGATGKNVYIKGKDHVLGRILFLFKSWIPETVGARFDPKYFDRQLNREEEGYYRTAWRLLNEKKLGFITAAFDVMLGRKTDITDELELSNFKKAVKEAQYIVTVWALYMLAKAAAPDDDKDRKLYNMLVLRQLNDLGRDLTYYGSISSIQELQRNPVSVLRTYANFGQAGKAILYYGLEVENDDGEILYDGERTVQKITKVVPFASNYNRWLWYSKQVN